MRSTALDVGDRVEVTDEASRLYHVVGWVVGLTRAGRPVVRFPRKRRTLRHPLGMIDERAMDPEHLGPVPPPS